MGPKTVPEGELRSAGRVREGQSRNPDCWLHGREFERRSRAVLALKEGAGSADFVREHGLC
jgi:hypothetical protein